MRSCAGAVTGFASHASNIAGAAADAARSRPSGSLVLWSGSRAGQDAGAVVVVTLSTLPALFAAMQLGVADELALHRLAGR